MLDASRAHMPRPVHSKVGSWDVVQHALLPTHPSALCQWAKHCKTLMVCEVHHGRVAFNEFILGIEQDMTVFSGTKKTMVINMPTMGFMPHNNFGIFGQGVMEFSYFITLTIKDGGIPSHIGSEKHMGKSVHLFLHGWTYVNSWQSVSDCNWNHTSVWSDETLFSASLHQSVINNASKMFHVTLGMDPLSSSKFGML